MKTTENMCNWATMGNKIEACKLRYVCDTNFIVFILHYPYKGREVIVFVEHLSRIKCRTYDKILIDTFAPSQSSHGIEKHGRKRRRPRKTDGVDSNNLYHRIYIYSNHRFFLTYT